jgi:diguanylate cyclase (GGDEF)-like protein
MAGDVTITSAVFLEAAQAGLETAQFRAVSALLAQMHLCYEVKSLAQCVAEHLSQLIRADVWRLNYTPIAVRAAFDLEETKAANADANGGESSSAPEWPELLETTWEPIETSTIRSHNAAGAALSVSLVVKGQALGTLEGSRTGRPALPFDKGEETLLTALAPFIAHALARAQRLYELEQLSFTDELTRLYNARYLRQRLIEEIKRARRNETTLTAIFLDIDDFKNVNDAHGHLVGSHVLGECSTVILSAVRGTDIVARYGGDEFVVILPETDLEQAEIVVERIRAKLAAYSFNGGGKLNFQLCASFGVAAYPNHAKTPQELLALADAAMYAAKDAGKNCVRYAS